MDQEHQRNVNNYVYNRDKLDLDDPEDEIPVGNRAIHQSYDKTHLKTSMDSYNERSSSKDSKCNKQILNAQKFSSNKCIISPVMSQRLYNGKNSKFGSLHNIYKCVRTNCSVYQSNKVNNENSPTKYSARCVPKFIVGSARYPETAESNKEKNKEEGQTLECKMNYKSITNCTNFSNSIDQRKPFIYVFCIILEIL